MGSREKKGEGIMSVLIFWGAVLEIIIIFWLFRKYLLF
jgi:hypothetical protein